MSRAQSPQAVSGRAGEKKGANPPQAVSGRAGDDRGNKKGRVLILAGSDSGGGAGIQADIKAVTMLGGFAATAITAVTVQNTLGVHGVHPLPLDVIEAQARAVLAEWRQDYNTVRPHTKLGGLTPAEMALSTPSTKDHKPQRLYF